MKTLPFRSLTNLAMLLVFGMPAVASADHGQIAPAAAVQPAGCLQTCRDCGTKCGVHGCRGEQKHCSGCAHGLHVRGHCGCLHRHGRLHNHHGDHGHHDAHDGRLAHLKQRIYATRHSGQPLIDPYMRADWMAAQQAAVRSWHAGYYNTQWGVPMAAVVPPTARMHTRYSWGVAQTTMMPLYHQYERPYPGPFTGAMGGDGQMAGSPLLPTPRWPSHTDQFGVYYIRGPW